MNQATAKESPPATSSSEDTPKESAHLSAVAVEPDKRDGDIERARQELLKRLDHYTPIRDVANLPKDRLNDRYVIHCDRPLPQFSYGNVRAYAASDEKTPDAKLYAAVCDPSRPYRHRVLSALEHYENPHLVRVMGHGIAHISALGEHRYVILFEQPQGRPLSDLLREGRAYNEQSFTEQIIRPIAGIVAAFEGMGINHCRITPENIFIGEKTVLGECISEPSGFSKDFFYEPIERLLSEPQGTGGGTTKVDTYDLGALAVDVLHSRERLKDMNKETYTAHILNSGTYNVLSQGSSFSDGFADFLIGTLNERYEERWSSAQLLSWLGGKRFNLLKPMPPREASRPFEFEGEQFFSGRALAHSFFTHWESARNFVRTGKIDRWMDQSIHKRDVADIIRRSINSTGGIDAKTPRQNSELLARVISVLDPAGPLRLEHLSFNLGGLGLLISDAMRNKKQKELALIRDVIDFDLLNFWLELQASPPSEEAHEALWCIQKNRHFLSLKGMGFGMERIMYDLCPNLPCLSANFVSYHVSNLHDMLYALDAAASRKAREEGSFTDRHLAAFLASHAGIMKEVSVKDFRQHAQMLQSPEIAVLIILAKAQEKAGIKQLKGLSNWAALRVLDTIKNIHSLQTRKALCRDLLAAADQGHIGFVLQALLNVRLLNGDLAGFDKALQTFQLNRHQINELRSHTKTKEKAIRTGAAIAAAISTLMLGISVYMVIRDHFFL